MEKDRINESKLQGQSLKDEWGSQRAVERSTGCTE